MLKHFFLVFFALAMATAIALADSHTRTISGVLATVDPTTIEVTTHGEEAELMLNTDTKYRKWIMAKPWQQDTHADFESLKVGMRVRVDVDESNPQAAKTVWIVVR
jgi:hypothetical protein